MIILFASNSFYEFRGLNTVTKHCQVRKTRRRNIAIFFLLTLCLKRKTARFVKFVIACNPGCIKVELKAQSKYKTWGLEPFNESGTCIKRRAKGMVKCMFPETSFVISRFFSIKLNGARNIVRHTKDMLY